MRVYFTGIDKRPHWIRLISICFIATVFALIGTHDPANGNSENTLDGVRFLLQRYNPPPTPTPTPTPTWIPTPSATPTPGVGGLFKNSAAGSSAGLALGSMAGIFFVLRRKDKD
ncbi:MAG: hypothetical protein OEM01_02820 [Desulfobulbaceae bacterium]|nr:hypothetical protein [Desulfobulbaceae bacterium]